MKRIVPLGARLHDSDEVKRLVDADFVQNAWPTAAAASIAPAFRELVAAHGDTLRAKLGVAGRAKWPEDPVTRLYAPRGSDTRLAYVFEEKIDYQLLSDLFACELVYLNEVTDIREVERHLQNEYAKTLAKRLERLRTEFKRAGIDTVQSTLGTSFALPAGLAAALTAAGFTLAQPVAAVAGIAFGAWTIWRRHRRTVDGVLKPSPEAYLYQASKFFTPKTLTSQISADSRRFAPQPSRRPDQLRNDGHDELDHS